MKIVCLYKVWLNEMLKQCTRVEKHSCKTMGNLMNQAERVGFSFKVEVERPRTSDPYGPSTWIYGLMSKSSGTHSLFYSRNESE